MPRTVKANSSLGTNDLQQTCAAGERSPWKERVGNPNRSVGKSDAVSLETTRVRNQMQRMCAHRKDSERPPLQLASGTLRWCPVLATTPAGQVNAVFTRRACRSALQWH